jgi:hypothetical protein
MEDNADVFITPPIEFALETLADQRRIVEISKPFPPHAE